MFSLKKISLLLFLFSISFSCTNSNKKENDRKKLQSYILQYLTSISSGNNGDNAAKIFYINPAFVASSMKLDLVTEATSVNVNSGKKKLVLIHGWDYNDNDSKAFSITEQKTRATSNTWANFFNSTTFFTSITVTKSYDIYSFDYLTSNTIDANGKRFRAKMDSLFGSESGTVVILAHSMGGLVSRFALYEGDKPAYLNRIITLGAPFHGSPWASPQYQGDKGSVGDIATFFTNTDGGKDLAWDNFDKKISGAANAKLTAINEKKYRDDLFYAYYGSVPVTGSGGSGASTPGLYPACVILGSNFAPSDCVVPSTSASLSGNTLTKTVDLGAYDHFDIKLSTYNMQTTFDSDLP